MNCVAIEYGRTLQDERKYIEHHPGRLKSSKFRLVRDEADNRDVTSSGAKLLVIKNVRLLPTWDVWRLQKSLQSEVLKRERPRMETPSVICSDDAPELFRRAEARGHPRI